MSIAGKFSDSGSPAALAAGQRLAEARRGQSEYEAKFPEFCQLIGLTIGELQKLDPNLVLTLMVMRTFNLLSLKLIELDARLAAAEGRASATAAPPSKEPLQ